LNSQPAKVKNVSTTPMGDRLGRIHLGKQDIDSIQTRKIKGLKKRARDSEGDAKEGGSAGKKAKKARVSDDL
jgi:ribosome production factor 2